MTMTSHLTSLSLMTLSQWRGTWQCLLDQSSTSVLLECMNLFLERMGKKACDCRSMLRTASTARHVTSSVPVRISIGFPQRLVDLPTMACELVYSH